MTNKTNETGRFINLRKLKSLLDQWQAHETKLTTKQRKQQWLMVMIVLTSVFMVSFIWSPWRGLDLIDNDGMKWSKPKAIQPAEGKNFEMPVDSFESYLKNDLHERLSEKE